MPSVEQLVIDFIDDIPDAKLTGGFVRGTIWSTDHCRFDSQGYTSNEPKHFNLQVQVNKHCPRRSMQKLAPKTVAICLAPVDNPWTPAQIKEALKETVDVWVVETPQQAAKKSTGKKNK
jgi:hypothetical protein